MIKDVNNPIHSAHLITQSYSHVYLVKYIAAAFAFERYRRLKAGTSLSLDEYAPPLNNLENLNDFFSSMSYSMRRALVYLNNYWVNMKKKTKFCQLDSKSNFSRYLKCYF